MKSLEEIFSEYFDYPAPFDYETGELTEQGVCAYAKLSSLIRDLEALGVISGAERIEDNIDDIIDGAAY